MKSLILFSVIALLSVVASGQVKISIGIKGGLNFSKLDVTGDTTSNKTGFHGGAFASFKFGKIGIQPEVIFSQQGSEINLKDWKSSYINIPIIIKYYLAAGLNLQVGPQFGFLGMAELDGVDKKDLMKSSDISVALGVGWEALFGLTFDARYNMGVSNNNDSGTQTIKNQVYQISIGFKIIRLGK